MTDVALRMWRNLPGRFRHVGYALGIPMLTIAARNPSSPGKSIFRLWTQRASESILVVFRIQNRLEIMQ